MGGILSGNRTFRGGRPSTATLPVARLVNSELYSLKSRPGPRVIPQGDGWAMVLFGVREWPVRLEITPLHFGGQRRWMACPRCSHRREALYVEREVLACRSCLKLGYESQNENRRGRMFRRANAIRARLGWAPGIVNPDGGKPARMHWRTFRRLHAELDALTNALLGILGDWLDKAEERVDRLQRPVTKEETRR